MHSSEELQAEKQVCQDQTWSRVVHHLLSTRPRKMQKELELSMRKIKQRFRQQNNIKSKSRQDKYHLVWSIFQETQMVAEEPAHLREKLLH